MSRYVSDSTVSARHQWPQIFEQLGIVVPTAHRHGPCPCCGGKDRFRMDDLNGRGTWFCNQCGAGDGLDLVSKFFGCPLLSAARKVMALKWHPLTPPARKKWQAGNSNTRMATLLRHCQPGNAPYLAKRGWQRSQWLLTERNCQNIGGFHFGAGTLVLPIRDMAMRLTGIQLIHPEGRKYLLPGSQLKAGFCPVHQVTVNGTTECWAPDTEQPAGIIITEGYATALAVSNLHPFPVVSAFSANNLKNVAVVFKERWPDCQLILAGDNDSHNQKNPGWLSAQTATNAVNGALAIPPGYDQSDWNEFYRHHGEPLSREAFNRQLPHPLRS